MQGPQKYEPLPIATLADYGLTEEDMAKGLQQPIPVVCAWCQPYIENSTSDICPSCEAKHFPHKQKAS